LPLTAEPLGPAEFAALMAPLGPFGPAPRLAAGVSGGPHSLALALLAQDFARARGGSVVGMVADHGLRSGSAAEAEWTIRTLRGAGVEAQLIALDLAEGAALQERARDARLAALLDCCAKQGRPWLLLGHHRMDQAETVLFRALRGSGGAGMAGMAALRPAASALLLRPLLGVPPARLEATLAARGIVPLRDPSNTDPRFTRVRLRQALGDPGGQGPAVAALAEAGAAFALRRAARRRVLADCLTSAATLMPEGWVRLDAAALGEGALADEALAALLRLVAGAEHAPAAGAVRALRRRGGGTLGGVLWREGLLCREPSGCAAPVPAVPNRRWDRRWRLRGAPRPGLSIGALGVAASDLPRGRRRGLPALVLSGLPALWRDGRLEAVPPLTEPGCLVFDPAGGPLLG
jgi:tRNA(Ile)-lysidine synthase